MTTIASVDIGTNSVLYSLFEVFGSNRLRELHFKRFSPRIGRNLTGKKRAYISEDSFSNLLKILRTICRHAEKNSAEYILIAATNPLRLAQNGKDIKKKLEWELGIPIEILSPDREAELSFIGAVGKLSPGKDAVMIDLGGGSTEFVAYRGNQRKAFASLPEGAVSLTEKFDSRLRAEKARYPVYEKHFSQYKKRIHTLERFADAPITLVGGTSSALAWLLDEDFLQKPKGTMISRKELSLLVNILAGMNLTCRKQLLSIDEKRAEIIFGGAFWLFYLFKELDIRKAVASPRGLRHGLVIDFLSG